LPLQGEARIARDDEKRAVARQASNDLLDHAVGELAQVAAMQGFVRVSGYSADTESIKTNDWGSIKKARRVIYGMR
jgi:hypothetical protein